MEIQHRVTCRCRYGGCGQELICILVVCIGTKAKKALKFNLKTMVIYPACTGVLLVGLCFIFHSMSWGMNWMGFPANRILYAICSVVGTMLFHQGLDGIAKYYNHKVGEDRFNFENESFEQSEKKVDTPYSVNIPMLYYWKRRLHNGYINIGNPFRGTIVLGTPGSGKSFGPTISRDVSLTSDSLASSDKIYSPSCLL